MTSPETPLTSHVPATNQKLLLMGSSAFAAKQLPPQVTKRIDAAISHGTTILVGEAHGASRLFQDYLHHKGYRNVIVGHARRIRYNAGTWPTHQYGTDLPERERRMIEDCHAALVIWMNHSGVIAENLERLKRLGKPTYLYECTSITDTVSAGDLDPKRVYDPYYSVKEQHRRRKAAHQ
jgi:hypothetical protein